MIDGLQGEFRDLDIKYLKQKISKCRSQISRSTQEDFAGMQDGCEILQVEGHHFAAKGWFRNLRNLPSTWCDWLPMAITSSFQLRFTHHLKCWIADFPSFETTYSMHEIRYRKCFKSCYPLEFFMLDFSLCFPSLHSWFAYGKGI